MSIKYVSAAWLLFMSVTSVVVFAELRFAELDLQLVDDRQDIVVSGNLGLTLGKTAEEALENGLPLVFIVEAGIVMPGRLWWDKKIWSESYVLDIQYHALSDQYLVKNAQNSFPRAFLTRDSAIHALGRLDNLKLVSKSRIKDTMTSQLKMRIRLDTQALPVPLRPLAFVSEKWRLISDWKTWPLR